MIISFVGGGVETLTDRCERVITEAIPSTASQMVVVGPVFFFLFHQYTPLNLSNHEN